MSFSEPRELRLRRRIDKLQKRLRAVLAELREEKAKVRDLQAQLRNAPPGGGLSESEIFAAHGVNPGLWHK